MTSLLWDQHTLSAATNRRRRGPADPLTRYQQRAGAIVSVNVGYSPQIFGDAKALLRHYRAAIIAHPALDLAATFDDVEAITRRGGIAVVFDLEDAGPLDDNLDNLATLENLGVRTLLPTYNHANRAGSGCLDSADGGLTRWGRAIVAEMNNVGIVPDGSHCSARTGLDMCESSIGPVIYSHSCMQAVWDHPRNITDDQARACAATGGVIGITGVGIFLGPNTPTLEAMTRHLQYAVELVGINHVGISTDFSFDYADVVDEITRNAHLFDDSYTRWGPIQWMPPETLLMLGEYLLARGWATADVDAVLGGNFSRLAQRVWRN